MKKNILIFLVILIQTAIVYSQVYQNWSVRYNGIGNGADKSRAIAINNNSDVFVTGFTGAYGNYDFTTLRYTRCGEYKWANVFDESDDDDGYDIAVNTNNEIIVAGQTFSVIFPYSFNYQSIKYGVYGNIIWSIPDGGYGEDIWKKVSTDNNNNIFLAGLTRVNNPYPNYIYSDYSIAKKDNNGITLWIRYYGASYRDDNLVDMTIDQYSNVYVTGGSETSQPGNFNYATVKYNSEGIQQWVAVYDGDANENDAGLSVAVDDYGNVYVTGVSREYQIPGQKGELSLIQNTFTTIKYNSSGAEQWVRKYFGVGAPGLSTGNSIIIYNNEPYVTGFAQHNVSPKSDYVTIKYNSSGIEQWVSIYDYAGGVDIANVIKADVNGNIYVTGKSEYIPGNATKTDYATIKYDANGVLQWSMRYNGAADLFDEPFDMVLDADGVYVTGKSVGNGTDFDYLTVRYGGDWPICGDSPGGDEPLSSVNGICRLNDSSAVTVGGNGSIKITTDKGESWRTINSGVSHNFNKVRFKNSNGIIVGENGSSLVTVNGGSNWTSKTLPVSHNIKTVQMTNSNIIYCAGAHGTIYRTANMGNNWINLSVDSSNNLSSVFFINSSKGFVTGTNGAIFKTNNGGLSWQSISLNTGIDFNNVIFTDTLTGFIIGNSGNIFKSTNAGNNWFRKVIPFSNNLNDICFVNNNTGYIAGSGGLILCTTNRGNTWSRQNTGSNLNFVSIAFLDNGKGLAAADNGRVITNSKKELFINATGDRFTSGLSDKPLGEKMDYRLNQNYPNPFNPETEITFILPEISRVKLDVYDVTGRLVTELINGNKHGGLNAVKFDGSNLASGVYFYKLTIFDKYGIEEIQSFSKKMVLVK